MARQQSKTINVETTLLFTGYLVFSYPLLSHKSAPLLHSHLKPRLKPCFHNPHTYPHHKKKKKRKEYPSQWSVHPCYSFYSLLTSTKTLAVDLFHDSPDKHKLKCLVQKPNSYFMDVKCPGMFDGGICQSYYSFSSFRLLRHHNRLLKCTNSGCLPFVHDCTVPTYGRKDKTD